LTEGNGLVGEFIGTALKFVCFTHDQSQRKRRADARCADDQMKWRDAPMPDDPMWQSMNTSNIEDDQILCTCD
jgi:hypothetical protein